MMPSGRRQAAAPNAVTSRYAAGGFLREVSTRPVEPPASVAVEGSARSVRAGYGVVDLLSRRQNRRASGMSMRPRLTVMPGSSVGMGRSSSP